MAGCRVDSSRGTESAPGANTVRAVRGRWFGGSGTGAGDLASSPAPSSASIAPVTLIDGGSAATGAAAGGATAGACRVTVVTLLT